LPVVLPGGSIDDIPEWMNPASATHYVVSSMTPGGAAKLLAYLSGRPGYSEPELGPLGDLEPLSPARDDHWRRTIQERMAEAWTTGDRAPLRAAERDVDDVLHDLNLTADVALLHPVRRRATTLEDGAEITPGSAADWHIWTRRALSSQVSGFRLLRSGPNPWTHVRTCSNR
jgi:hypothetical protein